MSENYLMYTSIVLHSLCYIPIVYADVKNKNANMYNLPDRFISILAIIFGGAYAYRINNTTLMLNYVIFLVLESGNICTKLYFIRKNNPDPCMIPFMKARATETIDESPEESHCSKPNAIPI